MIVDAHAHFFPHPCPEVALPGSDETFPLSRLLDEMDRAGVDRALLVQNPVIGIMNEAVQDAVRAFPDRFAGVVQVDPRSQSAAATLRHFCEHPAQRTLKLEISRDWGWSGRYTGFRLDEPALDPLWSAVEGLGVNVILDPGSIGNPGYQVEAIDVLSSSLSGNRFLIEHLGFLTVENVNDPAARQLRHRLLSLARKPNVFLGCSAVAALLDEAYPFPQSTALLREAVELVGEQKLLWGTDVPITLRRYTYRQMADFIALHCDFLDVNSRNRILGDNAAAIFFCGQ